MHVLDKFLPLWGTCEYEGSCFIAAAFPYLLPEEYYRERNVSRYAVVRDYHDICGARLEQACVRLRELYPGKHFEWHLDYPPLPEVRLAELAGLGHQGRHNMFITPAYGSWVFLSEIKSEVPLPNEACKGNCQSSCTGCAAPCIAACPTGALRTNGTFDRTLCLSAISQCKGGLTPGEAGLLRQTGIAWGCDLCQEACLRNKNIRTEPLAEFLIDPIAHVTAQTPLQGRAYAWRGKAVIHRNLAILEDS